MVEDDQEDGLAVGQEGRSLQTNSDFSTKISNPKKFRTIFKSD